MQIIGHKLIKFEPFFFVTNGDDFVENGQNLSFFDENLIQIAQEKKVNFNLICNDTKEAILANALGVAYIICDKKNAENFSKLAQFYIFDSKISCIIEDENEINELVNFGIDCVIFKKSIKNLK